MCNNHSIRKRGYITRDGKSQGDKVMKKVFCAIAAVIVICICTVVCIDNFTSRIRADQLRIEINGIEIRELTEEDLENYAVFEFGKVIEDIKDKTEYRMITFNYDIYNNSDISMQNVESRISAKGIKENDICAYNTGNGDHQISVHALSHGGYDQYIIVRAGSRTDKEILDSFLNSELILEYETTPSYYDDETGILSIGKLKIYHMIDHSVKFVAGEQTV